MTPEQALQILIAIINQAEFKGSIATISNIGSQANEAAKILAEAINPKAKEDV